MRRVQNKETVWERIVIKAYFERFGQTPEGNESLSWDIIECVRLEKTSGNSIRLIARHGIAAVPFVNISEGRNTNKLRKCYYSDSDLKKWLNETFLYEFFSEDEREIIQSIDIPSADDIEKWFPKESDRICTPTQFALNHGAAAFKNNVTSDESCVYWLSDTGRKAGMSASVVLSNGKIYKSAYLAAANVCIRPVIQVVRKEQRR